MARLAGGALPDRPVRHEILSTEPLKPFLKPMVSVIESGLYFSQSLRGEMVGGVSMPEEPNPDGEVRLGSRLDFLTTMARGLIALMPRLGHVKVVRQWAGPYDVSPDGNPIVGELPGRRPASTSCCGFDGHGFMMAPVVARHYAAYLDGERPTRSSPPGARIASAPAANHRQRRPRRDDHRLERRARSLFGSHPNRSRPYSSPAGRRACIRSGAPATILGVEDDRARGGTYGTSSVRSRRARAVARGD